MLLVLGDSLGVVRVARQVVDQVEQPPELAALPERKKVDLQVLLQIDLELAPVPL